MHLANDLFRTDPAGMPDMKLTLLFFRLVISLSTLYVSEYTSAFLLCDLHIFGCLSIDLKSIFFPLRYILHLAFFSFLFEFYRDVNKCHVVPRRHAYSYLMNKIMSMILPYAD